MEDVYESLEIPIRLIGSSGKNEPGFSSIRHGTFAAPPAEQKVDIIETVEFENIKVLDLELTRFSIGLPSSQGPDAWQQLDIGFKEIQSGERVRLFLNDLSTCLTTWIGLNDRNPMYGNLVVDLGWPAMKLNKPIAPLDGIIVRIQTSGSSKNFEVLTPQTLEALKVSTLNVLFAEGLKANRLKAKYQCWFLPIEALEELASTQEFKKLFKPLFSDVDKGKIMKSLEVNGQQSYRIKSFICNPTHTEETRSEKLFKLLRHLHLTDFADAKGNQIVVDEDTCDRLIKGRNYLSHKGTQVNEDLLYGVLFPLSVEVFKYLDLRT